MHVKEGLSKDCCLLFENMLTGFAYCKMVFDEKGKPVDFIHLEVNAAFEEIMRLKKEVVLGKRLRRCFLESKNATLNCLKSSAELLWAGRARNLSFSSSR